MRSEEIKETTTMFEVLARYGLKANRQGMICCPIHGERHPSMKVYKDGYHCFACGAHGDIFSFIQDMERCDFKTALAILGGTYEHEDRRSAKIAIMRSKARQETRRAQEERSNKKKELNNRLISVYRKYLDRLEPMSDAWADCLNALTLQLYIHEGLNEYEL